MTTRSSPPNQTPEEHFRTGLFGKILENAAWLIGAKTIGAVLSIVYLGLATRILGPASFGQFVLIVGIAQAASALVSFQTWQIVVRYGAIHLRENSTARLSRLFRFCLCLDICGAIVGAILAAAAVLLLGPMFDWAKETQLHAIIFAAIMLMSFRSTATGILRLYDRFSLAAVADAMTPIIRMLGALFVVIKAPTVVGFLIAWAAAEVVTACVYWIFAMLAARNVFKLKQDSQRGSLREENVGLWRFAFLTNSNSILNAASNQFVVILVGLFVGVTAAGGFRLAHQLGQGIAKLSATLSRAAFPELVRAHSESSRDILTGLFRRTTIYGIIGASVIIVVLLFFAGPLLVIVSGSEFEFATPYLILLGCAVALDLAGVGFEPTLTAMARAGRAVAVRFTSVTFVLIALFILMPLYGAMGAAVAVLSAAAFNLMIFGLFTWRVIHKS